MSTQRQFLLGALFLTALSILGFYTLFLTDYALFKDPIVVDVAFPEAHGLREGDPVTVAGMRIGRVKSLSFDMQAEESRRIQARLHLTEPIELVAGARITIKESSMLGGRHVDIYPGLAAGDPLELSPGEALQGEIAQNPLAALGSVGDVFAENSESFSRIVTNLALMTDDIRSGRGTVGQVLYSEELAKSIADAINDFRGAAENVRLITADIQTGKGLVGSLIYDEAMLADAKSTMAELRATSTGMRSILDDVQAGKGLAGQLLYNEKMGQDIATAVDNLTGLLAKIERGEGPLGLLINDPKIATELREIVANVTIASRDISALTAMVRNGQGSVGKLFTEDELYLELSKAVGLVTRSLEDYREAAPITAFTGVLFSAF